MSPLHHNQLSFKAITQENESNSSARPFRFTFGTEVTLDWARHALGFNFKGLEKGLIEVLRTERQIPADEPVPLDAFLVWVFALGCSTDLVDEWVSSLADAVAPYADCEEKSFTIRDTVHRVILTIRDNVVEEVRPFSNRTPSERRA